MPLSNHQAEKIVTTTRTALLRGEEGCARWRIVEVGSSSNLPFRLDVDWTAAGGGNASARITVTRATRICVYAKTVGLYATGLKNAADNKVWCTVADIGAPVTTANQWEVFGAAVNNSDQEIPPFAQRVRFDVGAIQDQGASYIELVDSDGAIRAKVFTGSMPPAGLELGGAQYVRVTSAGAWRLVFPLAL